LDDSTATTTYRQTDRAILTGSTQASESDWEQTRKAQRYSYYRAVEVCN